MEIVTKKENNFIQQENTQQTDGIRAKRIFKYYIAKGLIGMGHKVVDIKPDAENRDRVVFLFEDSIELRDDMQAIIKAHRKAIAAKESESESEE